MDVRETRNEKAKDIDHKVVIATTTKVLNNTPTHVQKMYERYQKKWIAYMERTRLQDVSDKDVVDKALLFFFLEINANYAPSTLYVIYSCINSWFIMNHGYKLNNCLRINRFLKLTTSTYVANKSKVLSADEIDILLKFCMKSTFHEDTLLGVCLALQYYGLLRVADVLKVQVKDVTCEKNGTIKVTYNHMRKRINPGFVFYIPAMYQQLFHTYMNQLDPNFKPDSNFLKNYTEFEYKRINNMGYKKASNLIKKACVILGKQPTGYTGHCMRRSAATNLADQGVSFVNLKRHGQWRSDSVVEGYIANSEPIRLERLYGLMPRRPIIPTILTPHSVRKPYPFKTPAFQSDSSDDEEIAKLLREGPVFKRKAVKLPPSKSKDLLVPNTTKENGIRMQKNDTYLVSPEGEAKTKKFKATEEEEASQALLSLDNDAVTFLKEVPTTPKSSNKPMKPAETEEMDVEDDILAAWTSLDHEPPSRDLPFMSQLTQNTTTGSVNLRNKEPETAPAPRREPTPPSTPKPAERTIDTTEENRKNVPKMILDLKEYLKGSTDFHNCSFTFNFTKE